MRDLTKYEQFLERKQREYGDKFDASKLDLRFVSAFNSGARIKVQYDDRVEFGTVGVTTGWVPAFILMHRRSAMGSSSVLGSDYKIVAVQRGKRYEQAAV